MGRVILCAGTIAEHPYYIEQGDIHVYTMDELCYYVYQHADLMTTDFFSKSMVTFIRNELGLEERSNMLSDLIQKKAGIKDLVVTLFCSSDLLTERQIKAYLTQLEEIQALPPIERKRRNADKCYREGHIFTAINEYKEILASKDISQLSNTAVGDVMHNIAVNLAAQGRLSVAAERFREAYLRNHRQESLMQYLAALQLGGQEKSFSSEMQALQEKTQLVEEINQQWNTFSSEVKNSVLQRKVMKLQELQEQGLYTQFYEEVDILLDSLKQEYRSRVIGG